VRSIRIVTAVLALAVVGSACAGGNTRPTLRFLELSPARVHGTHFGAGERVRVTLHAGSAKRIRTTRATRRGAFTVGFGTLDERNRCGASVWVTALGLRGHRATYRLPTIECPTPAMTSDRYDPS
jgi:hypothetical protein